MQLWDLKGLLEGKSSKRKDLQSLAAVTAHDKDINSVAISPNETLVCTTSQDRTAKVEQPWRNFAWEMDKFCSSELIVNFPHRVLKAYLTICMRSAKFRCLQLDVSSD